VVELGRKDFSSNTTSRNPSGTRVPFEVSAARNRQRNIVTQLQTAQDGCRAEKKFSQAKGEETKKVDLLIHQAMVAHCEHVSVGA
jgi:hypothetical protein